MHASAVFGLFFLPLMFMFVALRIGSAAYRQMRHRREHDQFAYRDEWRDQVPARPRARGSRPEVQVFRLAYKLGGRLTVSDLVVDMDLTIAEAEALLNRLVDHSRVTMEVRDDGLVFYEFPEILARRRGHDDDDLPTRV